MKKKISTASILLSLLLIVACVNTNGAVESKPYGTDKMTMSTSHDVFPILTRLENNPVMKLTLTNNGDKDYQLKKIRFSLKGSTAIEDIDQISLFVADPMGNFSSENQFGTNLNPSEELVFESEKPVKAEVQSLWLSVRLKDKVNLIHKLNISCSGIETSLGNVNVAGSVAAKGLRLGVALRISKDDGVNTYRIPGLATTKKGTLIAMYDARRDLSRDLQGNIDIAINRSFDGGETWQPLQIVLDMKTWGGLPEKYNGVSDANILVDQVTGDIFVAGLWMYGLLDAETGKFIEGLNENSAQWLHQWTKKGSQPGFGVKETSQFMIARSQDDGVTWSAPTNLTTQVKREEWWLFCPAPGHGITMSDGTLVMPAQGRDANGVPFSNIIYSKDHGITWKTGNPAYSGVNECMVVELSDKSLMLNMRDGRNKNNTEINGRVICTTKDLGKTWTEHSTSRKSLIEPTCMASLHKHYYYQNGELKSMLLFVNPNSISTRNKMTLKVSYDDGMTWPKDKWILLDQGTGRGYSCITSVDEQTIGIIYEGSKSDMIFQKVDIAELLE